MILTTIFWCHIWLRQKTSVRGISCVNTMQFFNTIYNFSEYFFEIVLSLSSFLTLFCICSVPDYEYELHIPFWSPHGAGGGISQVFTCTALQTDVSHCNVFIRLSKPIRIKVVGYLMFRNPPQTYSRAFRLPIIPSLLCKCNILSPGKQMSSDS